MSEAYRRRLVRVQSEFDAARDAIEYVLLNWQRQNVVGTIASSPEELRRAATSLEAVFFIRLFSTFEGILKEHLQQRHPPLLGQLRLRVHDVRRSWNSLVHDRDEAPPPLSFLESLAILGRFVNCLPEPY